MAESSTSSRQKLRIDEKIYVRIRLATKSDASHIYNLFYQMHEYHDMTHLYKISNKDSLCKMLFESNPNPRPFYSPTILLLEVSQTEFPVHSPDENLGFEPITKTFNLKAPIVDNECDEYMSSEAYIIAGYAFFFPSYTSSDERPEITVEGLYFRESYRKLGFGKLMFSTIATNVATKGFSSMDGIVAVWNKNAYNFFLDMGVNVMDDFRFLTLTGDALQAYANKLSNTQPINEMGRNGGTRPKYDI